MAIDKIKELGINNREEFRQWLTNNANSKDECWLKVKRGEPTDPNIFYYLDAVEEALCFGWIDSTYKKVDGIPMQRFTPRKKNSLWTERNKERVRRLERLGLMTDMGRAVLPDMNIDNFKIDEDVEQALKDNGCIDAFKKFPPLYQRVRAYNVAFYKKRDHKMYIKALEHLIEETKKGNMFGEWNDYGRLLDY